MKIKVALLNKSDKRVDPIHPSVLAMAKGMKKCGVKIKYEVDPWKRDYPDVDLVVCRGAGRKMMPWQKGDGFPKTIRNNRHYDYILKRNKENKTTLIVDTAYITRGNYRSVGINGLHGNAYDFQKDCPDDRFKATGVKLKDWNTSGDTVFIVGQAIIDSSHSHVNLLDWYRDVYNDIKENSDCNIVFKIHPKILRLPRQKRLWEKLVKKNKFFPKDIEVSTKPLTEEYHRAKFFVTFSSLVGVDSMLNGIPAVATDKTSMAYGVAAKSVKEMLKNYPVTPDRQQWLNNLAYKQWSMDELKSGVAWKYYEPEIMKKIEKSRA